MTLTPSPISVKKADGNPTPLVAYTDGTNSAFAHPVLDAAGAIISPATSGKQDAANASLAAIATNTALGSLSFSAAPIVTAGAYTAGMVVGGKIAVANAARGNGGSGLIQQAAVGKKTTLTAPFDLLVFHTDPSASFADHAALPDISADLAKLAGVIRCGDVVDCGTPQVLQALQQALQFKAAPDSSTIYVVPVVRAPESYATADAVTVTLGVIRD
jgi:hypothetical protein